jgi:hypothetical protein
VSGAAGALRRAVGPPRSVRAHLAHGAAGFGLLGAAVALGPVLGPVSLVLLAAGAVALRGCPACWVISLAAALSRGRLERTCDGGTCRVRTTRER